MVILYYLIIELVCVALVLYAIQTYAPIAAPLKNLICFLLVLVAVCLLLFYPWHGRLHLP